MLKELDNVRQVPGEGRRRWFADEYFDLIVWLDDEDGLAGFQLCYDKMGSERALTWRADGGYSHHAIDTGEDRTGRQKATPILVADGLFETSAVAGRFRRECDRIEPGIADFVYRKLIDYGV